MGCLVLSETLWVDVLFRPISALFRNHSFILNSPGSFGSVRSLIRALSRAILFPGPPLFHHHEAVEQREVCGPGIALSPALRNEDHSRGTLRRGRGEF